MVKKILFGLSLISLFVGDLYSHENKDKLFNVESIQILNQNGIYEKSEANYFTIKGSDREKIEAEMRKTSNFFKEKVAFDSDSRGNIYVYPSSESVEDREPIWKNMTFWALVAIGCIFTYTVIKGKKYI